MPRAERALPIRQALALGLVQGPAELLPVSSSAHTTLLPWFADWDYEQLDDELRKGFEVALHGGTAAALALLAGRELAADARQLVRAPGGVLVLALALAPAAIAGLALGRWVERALGGPSTIAGALAGGSAAMLAAERRADGEGGRGFADAGPADGLVLGLAQAVALVPGVSRSAATITAARFLGFGRRDSHRLSWTVALPVISGAALLQGLRLRRVGVPAPVRAAMATGAAGAFVSTLAAGAVLGDRARGWPLTPFALYRGALAALVVLRGGARRARKGRPSGDACPG